MIFASLAPILARKLIESIKNGSKGKTLPWSVLSPVISIGFFNLFIWAVGAYIGSKLKKIKMEKEKNLKGFKPLEIGI